MFQYPNSEKDKDAYLALWKKVQGASLSPLLLILKVGWKVLFTIPKKHT